jgi:hypothetical protein
LEILKSWLSVLGTAAVIRLHRVRVASPEIGRRRERHRKRSQRAQGIVQQMATCASCG